MPEKVHGTAGSYRKGCRCPDCRAWKSQENARTRAKRRRKRMAVVPDLPPEVAQLRDEPAAAAPTAGDIEAAVRTEIEAMSQVAEASVALALHLARVLDAGQEATAPVARQLEEVMRGLRERAGDRDELQTFLTRLAPA